MPELTPEEKAARARDLAALAGELPSPLSQEVLGLATVMQHQATILTVQQLSVLDGRIKQHAEDVNRHSGAIFAQLIKDVRD